jgi:hypothetical protein
LKEAREQQQLDRAKALAQEASRLRSEFFESVKTQKKAEAELNAMDAKRAEKNRMYGVEIKVF